jgi:ATP-dependent DNA helicase RecG
MAYLKTYHEAKRGDIDDLLLDRVSDVLNDEHKHHFVRDLLQEMRRDGMILPIGKTCWSGA